MLEKKLSMAEIMMSAYKLSRNLIDEKLAAEVNNFIGQMTVVEYVPLREKKAAIFKILGLLQEEDRRPDEVMSQIELMFTLEVIDLYTNIEIEPEFYEIFVEEFLDALEITGVLDAIEDISGKDIQRFHRMLDSVLNWRHIFSLIEGFENIDMSHVDTLANEIREARAGLTEDNLNTLKRISELNRPGVDNLSDTINAYLINSLDKITPEQLEKYNENQDIIIDLDNIFGSKELDYLTSQVQNYFNEHKELGTLNSTEIIDVYEYLKNKNAQEINKIDYQINENNKNIILDGVTSEIIKLLSKKKALEKKYQKQEELLKLADSMMSMDSKNINAIDEALHKIQTEVSQK